MGICSRRLRQALIAPAVAATIGSRRIRRDLWLFHTSRKSLPSTSRQSAPSAYTCGPTAGVPQKDVRGLEHRLDVLGRVRTVPKPLPQRRQICIELTDYRFRDRLADLVVIGLVGNTMGALACETTGGRVHQTGGAPEI